jgi:hypothetical protein
MKKRRRAKPGDVSNFGLQRRANTKSDTFNVGATLRSGIEIAAACSAHFRALPAAWHRVEESIFHGKNRSCDFCRMDAGETPARYMDLKDNSLYPRDTRP